MTTPDRPPRRPWPGRVRAAGLHRAARVAAVAAAVAASLLFVRAPRAPAPPPATVALPPPMPAPSGGPPLLGEADLGGADGAGRALAAGAPPEPVGIVGRLDRDGRALVRLADGTVRAIAVGEVAQGWTLVAIAPDRLRVARDGEERVLVLPIAPAGETEPAAPPVPEGTRGAG